MKKTILSTLITLIIYQVSAQKATKTSQEFVVEGLIKKELLITIDSLKSYATENIDSIVITNHLGERKSTLKNIKAVLLKNVLTQIDIIVESARQLSEFYFIFLAADGYKVVFSWNEIFNNTIGQNIYIITERDGKKIEDLEDRMSIFSQKDFRTGRRYVKGLKKIIVKRADE